MLAQIKKEKQKKILKKEDKNLSNNIKSQVAKKIETKKAEIKKLQELYHNPKEIPDEIKVTVAKTIETKKNELEKIYNSVIWKVEHNRKIMLDFKEDEFVSKIEENKND